MKEWRLSEEEEEGENEEGEGLGLPLLGPWMVRGVGEENDKNKRKMRRKRMVNRIK